MSRAAWEAGRLAEGRTYWDTYHSVLDVLLIPAQLVARALFAAYELAVETRETWVAMAEFWKAQDLPPSER